MRFNGILALALACGPAVILAAPTGPLDGTAAPSSSAAALAPTTQSSSMANGGQDGLLDKVEQILKEVLGSLRKRGLTGELGDQVDKLLEEVGVLLNGKKGSQQSSFSQSVSPAPQGDGGDNKAEQPATPAAPTAPSPAIAPQPKDGSSSSSTGSSPLAALLGGKRAVLRRRGGSLLNNVEAELTSPLGGSTPTPSSQATPSRQATPQSSEASHAPADHSLQGGETSSSGAEGLSPSELSQLAAALEGSSSSSGSSSKKTPKIPTRDEDED